MKINKKGLSRKASLTGALLGLITCAGFLIYGLVYNYFDSVVFLSFALGAVLAFGYVASNKLFSEVLNLLAVICMSFGVGLFFLNSYPVWADRLNNITMYGSRGTLVPVVCIMVLSFLTIAADLVSCFSRKEGSAA